MILWQLGRHTGILRSEYELVFAWLPKRSMYSKKLIWLQKAWRVKYPCTLHIRSKKQFGTTILVEYHSHLWATDKEYFWHTLGSKDAE